MPSKANFSRLFSPATDEPTCRCCCHTAPKKTRNAKNSLTPPRRWLERICRRPSLASSESSESSIDELVSERKTSLLRDFKQLYQTVEEELDYATESQGSIYYEDDLATAKRALGKWLDCYEELIQTMQGPELLSLHIEWETSRNKLYERLKRLPLP
ncbi:hypothetical protein BJV82DRAFT_662238 [Fennellomyces sp. T-0311]|nr:hypothetical protein BJV82DRAFT_662238 [Fennellomyces sp. T-0311]